eukprot:scaffold6000_cov103-Skeletonema_dohrnii-CCMP3373.AAC.1
MNSNIHVRSNDLSIARRRGIKGEEQELGLEGSRSGVTMAVLITAKLLARLLTGYLWFSQ